MARFLRVHIGGMKEYDTVSSPPFSPSFLSLLVPPTRPIPWLNMLFFWCVCGSMGVRERLSVGVANQEAATHSYLKANLCSKKATKG